MATRFTDHFSTGVTTFAKAGRKSAGETHGGIEYRLARWIEPDNADGDQTRVMRIHSSERVWNMLVSSDGAGTTATADIGVNYMPTDPDGSGIGTVIDQDRFASALDVASPISHVDQFLESAVLDNFDRGKQLWEICGLTSDPKVLLEIVFTFVAGTTTAMELQLIAVVSPGPAS